MTARTPTDSHEESVRRESAGRSDDTVPGAVFAQVGRLGSRGFITHYRDGEWRTVTWSRAGELVTRVACGLVEAGLEPGQCVALIAPNRLEWIIADWGIQAAGGITVPIYPTLTTPAVHYICRDSDAVIAVAGDEQLAAKLSQVRPLTKVALMDGELQEWFGRDFEPATRYEVERRGQALRPGDVATIMYTSGTTGDPKGVVLTHSNFVEMARTTAEVFPITSHDVVLSWMPLSHVYERMSGTFTPTIAGATLWISRGQDHLIEDLTAARPTVMAGVPRLWEKLYQYVHDTVRRGSRFQRLVFDWSLAVSRRRLAGEKTAPLRLQTWIANLLVLHRLRTALTGGRLRCFVSGGAPLGEKVEEFFWLIGVQLLQGYGLTETTSACTTNTPAEHKYGTVGRAMPSTAIRVAGDGEILVRGPGVMREYWRRPDATAGALSADGWFRTGDLGYLDADGFLSITGRTKELIKTSGGKYVAPLPIEARLEENRYITSAVLVGDGRPYCVALIVPDWNALAKDAGFAGDPDALRVDPAVHAFFESRVDAVNRHLASFESIKYFALLPRELEEAQGELTPTAKIKRRVIAERFRDEIDRLYAAGTARAAAASGSPRAAVPSRAQR